MGHLSGRANPDHHARLHHDRFGETATTYDAGTYYPLQDLLYRTTATVTINDESAVIQEAFDFDAYGKTLIFNAVGTDDNWWADNARQVSNSLCQFLFTGQRYDSETGLYYYKRRYYSPVLGRFLSRDPVVTLKRHEPVPIRGSSRNRFVYRWDCKRVTCPPQFQMEAVTAWPRQGRQAFSD